MRRKEIDENKACITILKIRHDTNKSRAVSNLALSTKILVNLKAIEEKHLRELKGTK